METILNEIGDAIRDCPDPAELRAEIIRIYDRHRKEMEARTAGVPLFQEAS